MSSEVMVAVRGLSKLYNVVPRGTRPGTLTQALLCALRGTRAASEEFWALKEVDFEVRQGEVVGLMGHNGAGKSTLLKLLSRITEPTGGEIALYGRIGSLLEVGTGFHPELTGRENIFMNGSILGMSRHEIHARFEEIVDFAGPRVQQHLETPVKRYSSGMTMRLGFAVAANLNPEILIVDEVLAVGDAEFQKKCLGKMHEVAQSGRTVFFVSHHLAAITSLCTRALLLHEGRVQEDGPVAPVVAAYQQRNQWKASRSGDLTQVKRTGSGAAQFMALELLHEGPLVYSGSTVAFVLTVSAKQAIRDAVVTLSLSDSNTYRLIDATHGDQGAAVSLAAGETARVRFTLIDLLLKPALYTLRLSLALPETEELDTIENAGTLEVALNPEHPPRSLQVIGPYTCRYQTALLV